MKTIVKIVVIVACLFGTTLVVSSSCKKKDTATKSETSNIKQNLEEDIRIDIGQDFTGERVIIELDGKEVFNDTAVTNWSLGIVSTVHVDASLGTHEIYVNVDGVEKTASFKHEKDRIVFVDYNPNTSEISFAFGHGPLVYD